MDYTLKELAERIATVEKGSPDKAKEVHTRLKTLTQRVFVPTTLRGTVSFVTEETATAVYLLLSLQEAGVFRDRLDGIAKRIFSSGHYPGLVAPITKALAAVKDGVDVTFRYKVLASGDSRLDFGVPKTDDAQKASQVVADAGTIHDDFVKVIFEFPFSELTKRLLAKD